MHAHVEAQALAPGAEAGPLALLLFCRSLTPDPPACERYGVSYAMKFAARKVLARDYVVPPGIGVTFNGSHHEIYLSDPRKTEAPRLRTILRQPIRNV